MSERIRPRISRDERMGKLTRTRFGMEAKSKITTVQTESGENQIPQTPTTRSIRHERQGNQDRNIFDDGGSGTGLDLRDPNEHIGV